jgi:protein-tyrosine-phosphatase
MRREIRDRTILFLCEDNACLSQMAEASAKHLGPPKTRIFSAGLKPSAIPPHVVQAMTELGINMTGQRSKGLTDVPMQDIDLVVSFGDAHRKCHDLPRRAKIENWPAPEYLKLDKESAQELPIIRDERDKIDRRVFALFLDYWRNIS